MTNSKKRGFTIIELVIVIAVIAILAGVLIPTFVSVIKKANVSSDTALVRNINEALAAEDVTDKPTTMNRALKVAKKYGFSVEKLTPRSSGEIVWNSISNRFALVEDGKVVYSANGEQIPNDASVWKIAHEEKGLDAKYSNYLAYEVAAETTLTVTSGLDVGENTGVNVIYNYNGTQNVTIRTNGGTLEINAENSEVAHYGAADFTNIVAVKENSYHEFGVSAYVSIAKGRFVAEATAKVIELNVANNGVIVATEQGATIAGYSKGANDVTVTVNGATVEVSEVKEEKDVEKAAAKSKVVENGVAEINGIQFKDLQSAFNAAKDGDTVNLISDYVIPETVKDVVEESIVIKSKITLNFGSYRVIGQAKMADYSKNFTAIIVDADTKFVAEENGGIITAVTSEGIGPYGVNIRKGAKLTIEGGSYFGGGTAIQVQEGTLEILGGKFSCAPYDDPYFYKYLINAVDKAYTEGKAIVSIKGGTFEKFNPADCGAEGEHTNFCAEGYNTISFTDPNKDGVTFWKVEKAN